MIGRAEGTIEFFPAPLPVLQLFLGCRQIRGGGTFRRLYALELRLEPRDFRSEAGRLPLIALNVSREVVQSGHCLREIRALTLAQLARVLNGLLHPGDIGAHLVVPALYSCHPLALFPVEGALLLDGSFGGPLISQRRLHRDLAPPHRAVVNFNTAVQIAHAQGEQLRRPAAFALFQGLIAPRGRRLALQMTDLLVDLIA